MPETRLRAFLSSTSDLVQEREAIAAALPRSFAAYRYEEDRARKASPRAHLQKMLRDSDVFLGILGERYGSVYPDCGGDPSIVQWEFETARAQEDCELMAFRKARLDPGRLDPRQQQFLGELAGFEGGMWMKTYESIPDLSEEVRDSLLDWLAEFRLRDLERRARDPVTRTPRLAAAVAAMAVAGLMFWFRDRLFGPEVIGLMILMLVVGSVAWFAVPRLTVSSTRSIPHGT